MRFETCWLDIVHMYRTALFVHWEQFVCVQGPANEYKLQMSEPKGPCSLGYSSRGQISRDYFLSLVVKDIVFWASNSQITVWVKCIFVRANEKNTAGNLCNKLAHLSKGRRVYFTPTHPTYLMVLALSEGFRLPFCFLWKHDSRSKGDLLCPGVFFENPYFVDMRVCSSFFILAIIRH